MHWFGSGIHDSGTTPWQRPLVRVILKILTFVEEEIEKFVLFIISEEGH